VIEVGDEVEIDGGRGTVVELVTSGTVKDPLTGDDLVVLDPSDPVMMLDTEDGRTAVYQSEAKELPAATAAGWAELVPMLAEFEAAHEDDPGVIPSGRAVKTVFERGVRSWPGPAHTELSADEWGLGRTRAFLTVAAGGEVPGYEADRDLLPE
jgi:hypothetical protein